MKIIVFILMLLSTAVFAEAPYTGKKILYINSYHTGYEWSDGIVQGIQDGLKNTGVELKMLEMDAMHYPDELLVKLAALKAKMVIEQFQPDVVITSDDIAAKYLIAAYYKDADLPFVFSGVNWDASSYGFPYKNVTGMVEVGLVTETIKLLQKYAKGTRIGFLGEQEFTERKTLEYHANLFNIKYDKVYLVRTFKDWKQKYLKLQEEVDMMMMRGYVGVVGFDDKQARAFVENHTKIPTGTVQTGLKKSLVLLGIAKLPKEQGQWAAQTALKILDGISPSEIPLTKNKEGRLIINLRLGNKLGIVFDEALLEYAQIIR